MTNIQRNRVQSIDAFRLAAAVAVIAIHTSPFRPNLQHDLVLLYKFIDQAINQLARVAVPFFLIISGYFWGKKVRKTGNPIYSAHLIAKRIGILFFPWFIIYLFPFSSLSLSLSSIIYGHESVSIIELTYNNFCNLLNHPIKLLIKGSETHLWFLIALVHSVYITALFVQNKSLKKLIILAWGLYLFGLLAKAYGTTPLGISLHVDTYGHFFTLLFFVTGYILGEIQVVSLSFTSGFLLFAAGMILQGIEATALFFLYETYPLHDYLLGTYFAGTGISICVLSLSNKLFAGNTFSKLCSIGKLTPGIYLSHHAFVNILRPVDKKNRCNSLGNRVSLYCIGSFSGPHSTSL